jgi:DeoR family transcriptional regulator, myo-inositol catabolism operon repressor
MKSARIDAIEQYILKKNTATIEEICEHFDISKSTLRRDLQEVVSRGRTKKIYGGVQAVPITDSQTLLKSFDIRNTVNSEEKMLICRLASRFIKPQDVVFIDTGTTCIHLIKYVNDISFTVITNSLMVAYAAASNPNITVIITPGRLNRKTMSFTGPDVGTYLRSVNIQKAFMATTGLSIHGGLTNASEDEFNVKKIVCQNSRDIYVLADHSKFGRTALYTYSPLNQLKGIITDEKPADEIFSYCRRENIELIYEEL